MNHTAASNSVAPRVHTPLLVSDQNGARRVLPQNSTEPCLVGRVRVSPKGGWGSLNTTYTNDVWTVASDVSMVARNIAWIENTEIPDPGLVYGLGYTSAVSVITGPLQVVGGMESLRSAQKIGDVAGKRIAQAQIARGVVDGVNGLTITGMRTMSLLGLKSTAETVATAGLILGYLASGLWTLSLGMQTVQFAVNTIRSASVLQEINTIDDLLAKWMLSKEDMESGKSAIAFKSADELYGMVNEHIELTENEAGILTDSEKVSAEKVIEEKLTEIVRGNYPEITDWDQVKDHLTVRYMKELARIKMVKEADYERVIGPDSLKMMKLAVKNGTIATEAAAIAIVTEAREEAYFNVFFNGLLLFAGIIGVASFIATTVFTGGAFLVAGYAVMLVMNFIMSGADVYSLFKDFDSLKTTSLKDILTLALFALVTITTVAAGAFFASSGGMLIMILVLGALMLAIQSGTMIYAIHKYKPDDDVLTDSDTTPPSSPLLGRNLVHEPA